MDGWTHAITCKRWQDVVDADGVPIGDTTDRALIYGVVHEYSGAVRPDAGVVGSSYEGHALVPYGTDLSEGDEISVVFPDGRSRSFAVHAVRDNHICLRLDLDRQAV